MDKIILNDAVGGGWTKRDDYHIIGTFEYNKTWYGKDRMLSPDITEHVLRCDKEVLKNFNGNFAIIIESDDVIVAMVDRINSYPLFFSMSDEGILITNTLHSVGEKDVEKGKEFLACGYNIGNSTIYKGIYQLLGGQVLIYSKRQKEYRIEDYFLHIHYPVEDRSISEWITEYQRVTQNVFDRFVQRVDGKTIALFLSGGYDSKLIASELKKRNYENVVCVILGDECTKDVQVAKVIAEKLDYPIEYINVNRKYWGKKRQTGEMEHYFEKCALLGNMPYLQGYVIKDLINSGRLPNDCIVVTGNSGDVIEGEDITRAFQEKDMYSLEDINNWISWRHFMLNGEKEAARQRIRFEKLDYFSRYEFAQGKKFNEAEAENVIEFFNWRERQCKYVVQDIRNYDTFIGNIGWLLPLWDNEIVDFWLSVPYSLRYKRKLYYLGIGEDSLPSANSVSSSRVLINGIKKRMQWLVKHLYWIKAIINYSVSNDFYFAPYGLIKKRELIPLIIKTRGFREPHSEFLARKTFEKY